MGTPSPDEQFEYSGSQSPEPMAPEVAEFYADEFGQAVGSLARHLMTKAVATSQQPITVTFSEAAPPPDSAAYSDDSQLDRDDIQVLCNCERSKAQKIMQMLPSFKIGRKRFVYYKDYKAYIEEHGEIRVKW